jgi:hypothetical protein
VVKTLGRSEIPEAGEFFSEDCAAISTPSSSTSSLNTINVDPSEVGEVYPSEVDEEYTSKNSFLKGSMHPAHYYKLSQEERRAYLDSRPLLCQVAYLKHLSEHPESEYGPKPGVSSQ